jgi:hypothetical protein
MDEKKTGVSCDFFNLNSDSEKEEEALPSSSSSNSNNFEKQLQKWDWDRPENFDLYYKYNTRKPSSKTEALQKRSLVASCCDANEKNESKKKHKIETVRETFFIDRIQQNEGKNGDSNKLKFSLSGHTAAVNRINWCKRAEHRDILLSSSMDG